MSAEEVNSPMLESVNDEDSSYQNIEQTVPEITVCNSFKVSTVDRLNHFKESALHLATCYASTSLIGKLIEKGADVNGKDSEGRTPLHRAVKTNTSQSVELLLCKGADANALDKNMETPIFIAIKRTPGLSFIKALVQHGADLNVKDSNGKTALEIAFETSELEKAK